MPTGRRVFLRPISTTRQPKPKPGDRVRVRSGVMEAIEGTVLGRAVPCRIIMSVDLAQPGVTLEIDDQQVEVIA
jgi:hypothetical protein